MLDKTKIKTESIRFSILPQDKQEIQNIAKRQNMTVSALIREAIDQYIKSIKGESNDENL